MVKIVTIVVTSSFFFLDSSKWLLWASFYFFGLSEDKIFSKTPVSQHCDTRLWISSWIPLVNGGKYFWWRDNLHLFKHWWHTFMIKLNCELRSISSQWATPSVDSQSDEGLRLLISTLLCRKITQNLGLKEKLSCFNFNIFLKVLNQLLKIALLNLQMEPKGNFLLS